MLNELTRYPLRTEVRALCLAVGASAAVAGAWAAIGAVTAASPIWFSVAFQSLIVVAGVFCVLLALGRFAEGPAVALLCASGTMLVGGLLSEVTRTSALGITSVGPRALAIGAIIATVAGAASAAGVLVLCALARSRPLPVVAAAVVAAAAWGAAWAIAYALSRKAAPGLAAPMPWNPVLLGGLLLGCSGASVLVRQPAPSLKDLLIGGALGAAGLAIVGGGLAAKGQLSQLGGMIAGIIVIVAFFVVLGLVAAATHLVIRAFERGRAAAAPAQNGAARGEATGSAV